MQNISDTKCQKTNTINDLQNKSSKILCKDDEPIKNISPDWPRRDGCKQITSKQKPPHLRSKVRKHLHFKFLVINFYFKFIFTFTFFFFYCLLIL